MNFWIQLFNEKKGFKKLFNPIYNELLSNEFRNENGLVGYSSQEERHWYFVFHQLRFQEIFSLIPNSKNSLSLLDIGCNEFTILLKRVFPHYEIHAIDKTSQWQETLLFSHIQFKTCDLSKGNLPYPDNYFNVILLNEVMEHLPIHPSIVLREISRILKRKGILILTTPNFPYLKNRIQLLFGKQILQPFKIDNTFPGHFREYTMNECISLLGNDFSIRMHVYPNYRDKFELFWKTPKLGFKQKVFLTPIALIYFLMVWFLPSLRRSMLFVCQKRVC